VPTCPAAMPSATSHTMAFMQTAEKLEVSGCGTRLQDPRAISIKVTRNLRVYAATARCRQPDVTPPMTSTGVRTNSDAIRSTSSMLGATPIDVIQSAPHHGWKTSGAKIRSDGECIISPVAGVPTRSPACAVDSLSQ